MNRRELLSAVGKGFIGTHLSSILSQIADFLWDCPALYTPTSTSVNSALSGFIFGYGTALNALAERKGWGFPYLHALCHCYAVASMDAPDWERCEWSKWGGMQDELIQQYWAQHYRREVHPRFVQWLINNGMQSDYSTMMQFCWGTPEQKLRAEKRVRLFRGKLGIEGLESLDRLVTLSRDACESAFQASDETDNELGRQLGLKCPKHFLSDDEARLAWCQVEIESAGVLPGTPEGPGTDREFGPFHLLYPGPSWEFLPKQQEPYPLVEL